MGDNGAIFGGCLERVDAVGVPISRSLGSGTSEADVNAEKGGGEGGRGICIPDCRNEVARADIGGLTRGVIVEGEKEEWTGRRDSRGEVEGSSLNERIIVGPPDLIFVEAADDCRRVWDRESID
jgi:hypothetical protein